MKEERVVCSIYIQDTSDLYCILSFWWYDMYVTFLFRARHALCDFLERRLKRNLRYWCVLKLHFQLRREVSFYIYIYTTTQHYYYYIPYNALFGIAKNSFGSKCYYINFSKLIQNSKYYKNCSLPHKKRETYAIVFRIYILYTIYSEYRWQLSNWKS